MALLALAPGSGTQGVGPAAPGALALLGGAQGQARLRLGGPGPAGRPPAADGEGPTSTRKEAP